MYISGITYSVLVSFLENMFGEYRAAYLAAKGEAVKPAKIAFEVMEQLLNSYKTDYNSFETEQPEGGLEVTQVLDLDAMIERIEYRLDDLCEYDSMMLERKQALPDDIPYKNSDIEKSRITAAKESEILIRIFDKLNETKSYIERI
jgi:hypothetical protein